MRWHDLAAAPVPEVSDFLRALQQRDAASARRLRQALDDRPADSSTPLVALEAAAMETALYSVAGFAHERGGLLLGTVFRDADRPSAMVQVRLAVPGHETEASPVSLTLETAVWDAARAQLQPGEQVVGWYHSHPGLGAFFSATDRRTQAAFFREPHSLGWVIDPVGVSQAWFAGAQAHSLALADITWLPAR
jgi:proteasome lid subunit RPN8/RPN11